MQKSIKPDAKKIQRILNLTKDFLGFSNKFGISVLSQIKCKSKSSGASRKFFMNVDSFTKFNRELQGFLKDFNLYDESLFKQGGVIQGAWAFFLIGKGFKKSDTQNRFEVMEVVLKALDWNDEKIQEFKELHETYT